MKTTIIAIAALLGVAIITAQDSSTAFKTYIPRRLVLSDPAQTIPLPGPVASDFGAMVFLNGSLIAPGYYTLHKNTTLTAAGVEVSWSIRLTYALGSGSVVQILYFSEQ